MCADDSYVNRRVQKFRSDYNEFRGQFERLKAEVDTSYNPTRTIERPSDSRSDNHPRKPRRSG